MTNDSGAQGEAWEREVLAGHRWGRHGEKASQKCSRLKKLRDAAGPLDEKSQGVLEQIIALEICNWNFEESILTLCKAIGANQPAKTAIGHLASVSEERWRKVWAYYLALRRWLRGGQTSGYVALLTICDPDKEIEKHIECLLGSRNELKQLYVERFCLCLEAFLDGTFADKSARPKGHAAAVSALEAQIKKYDAGSELLRAMTYETGGGRLFPCSHKAFRRYDIIISSIGAGKWRAAMPTKGMDGFERADMLEKYLSPIQAWTDSCGKANGPVKGEFSEKIFDLLGEHSDKKLFLASLLVSLLRCQQQAAKARAQSRT